MRRSKYGRQVHIVTDSEYVANMGSDQFRRKKNTALWKALDNFALKGIILHWHHLRRSLALHNIEADRLSRSTRIAVENVKPKIENECLPPND